MYNKLEIRVFGPRRSGNHAIINWLAYQAQSKIYFFNCASNRGHNPYRTGKCRGDQYNEDLQSKFEQVPNLKHADEDTLNYYREVDKDILMYSYEDIDLDKYVRPRGDDFPINRSKVIGDSSYCIDVVILRDVHNWLASKLKYNTKKNDYREVSILAKRYEENRKVRNKMPYFSSWRWYSHLRQQKATQMHLLVANNHTSYSLSAVFLEQQLSTILSRLRFPSASFYSRIFHLSKLPELPRSRKANSPLAKL